MNPTKTFTPISQLIKPTIGRCSAVLPNRMQCWKAGEYEVKQVFQGTNPEEPNKVAYYQLCRAHAVAEQQEYEKAVADEAAVAKAETEAAADSTQE